MARGLQVVGLFAGIGGIELGLTQSGHSTRLLCEVDCDAQAVLRRHFPDAEFRTDIRRMKTLPPCGLVTAGFPCQDLSPAGLTTGISGSKSGLVSHLFRLLECSKAPEWILLENVPFMLQLDRGRAIAWVVSQLEKLGYEWAYRTIDTRAFGLPHRRRRVLILASKSSSVRDVLFADEAQQFRPLQPPAAFGFYWTEGNTGLGWAEDAIPTLKSGSGLNIPSPPAIWVPDTGEIGSPDIRDAERLQGFKSNWTNVLSNGRPMKLGTRWRLLGNAVSVPVARWIGARLSSPGKFDTAKASLLAAGSKWPKAAFGKTGKRWSVEISEFPETCETPLLHDFLTQPLRPLSLRAARGFLTRIEKSSLKRPDAFISALRKNVANLEAGESEPSSSIATARMRAVRQRETDVEVAIASALSASGMSFEQNVKAAESLRTMPDFVFRGKRLAIYVDGCFWHGCPTHGTQPKANSAFWSNKLSQNRQRDRDQVAALMNEGWKVLRFWSHEDPNAIVVSITRELRKRG